jgi:hypothetical protein
MLALLRDKGKNYIRYVWKDVASSPRKEKVADGGGEIIRPSLS